MSSAGSWDSGLQCSQDSYGKTGMISRWTDRVIELKFTVLRAWTTLEMISVMEKFIIFTN